MVQQHICLNLAIFFPGYHDLFLLKQLEITLSGTEYISISLKFIVSSFYTKCRECNIQLGICMKLVEWHNVYCTDLMHGCRILMS